MSRWGKKISEIVIVKKFAKTQWLTILNSQEILYFSSGIRMHFEIFLFRFDCLGLQRRCKRGNIPPKSPEKWMFAFQLKQCRSSINLTKIFTKQLKLVGQRYCYDAQVALFLKDSCVMQAVRNKQILSSSMSRQFSLQANSQLSILYWSRLYGKGPLGHVIEQSPPSRPQLSILCCRQRGPLSLEVEQRTLSRPHFEAFYAAVK